MPLGYNYALCTTRANNKPEIHILETHGWKKLDTFNNNVTGHDLILWGKLLFQLPTDDDDTQVTTGD